MELAYLHPRYYTPDDSIFSHLGIKKNHPYIIMRFVSWKANHDRGHSGISTDNKIKAVKEFSEYAKVFISSESELPTELKDYQIKIPPEKMHDALAYASLVYGESATMASEAAVLGIPAIYIDDVGRGYTTEEENMYDLVYNFTESLADQEKSIIKGKEILQTPGLKKTFLKNRDQLIEDKIDVTAFLVWFIENFPNSATIMHENPDYQYNFR